MVCLLLLGGGGKCVIELGRGEGGKRGCLIKYTSYLKTKVGTVVSGSRDSVFVFVG